jgi:CRISPR-associated protein Cmr4
MFEAARMLYLYVESPLHAGTGRGLGAVDLPVQRERVTGYPLVQASGIKGALRSECEKRVKGNEKEEAKIKFVFGPDTKNAPDHAGAVSPGDARLLLFPVRALAGVFAWTTSADALARFQRVLMAVGEKPAWTIPEVLDKGSALTATNTTVIAGGKVVLDEFSFTPKSDQGVDALAKWLAGNVLPTGEEYAYWRKKMLTSIVILPEDAFRDFTQFATEVVTRVKLDSATKTVESGALWTEENLPVDTLLYVPFAATEVRRPKSKDDSDPRPGALRTGKDALGFVATHLDSQRIQLGGDETVGRGTVSLRFGNLNALNGRGG